MEYELSLREAEQARLHRVMALRAMIADGQSQGEIARRLGVTQPAVSYQVSPVRTDGVRPSQLLAAGGSVLRRVAEGRGFTRLAVFGSGARGDDRADSDVDLLVQPPTGADAFDMVHLEDALEIVLGRKVDLVSYRGLDPRVDGDILRDAVEL